MQHHPSKKDTAPKQSEFKSAVSKIRGAISSFANGRKRAHRSSRAAIDTAVRISHLLGGKRTFFAGEEKNVNPFHRKPGNIKAKVWNKRERKNAASSKTFLLINSRNPHPGQRLRIIKENDSLHFISAMGERKKNDTRLSHANDSLSFERILKRVPLSK
ncbi:hypothetical protein NPIL_548131 [Nephila pilipes]|uniref:Uncharacterized protein n=1 Tax=Nephila pilipes TaxID=299642 RepID=A0A8X6PQV7_NEPPI|nr:hypothetical protein NPIL_548131 [Nephila pilipes]